MGRARLSGKEAFLLSDPGWPGGVGLAPKRPGVRTEGLCGLRKPGQLCQLMGGKRGWYPVEVLRCEHGVENVVLSHLPLLYPCQKSLGSHCRPKLAKSVCALLGG